MKRIAMVTGANRGIGFEIARRLGKQGTEVILTSRNEEKGRAAAEKLKSEGLPVVPLVLDVSSLESIHRAGREVSEKFGRLDILINNAGIFPENSERPTPPEEMIEAFRTNAMGAYFMCQEFFPLMKKKRYGRIVNLSSGMGQLSEMQSGYPAYRMSKIALNAVTRMFASEAEGSEIKVNSMCPGWVRTDMGGPQAERTPEQGADTAVWLATLPGSGPNGGFFRDREPIQW